MTTKVTEKTNEQYFFDARYELDPNIMKLRPKIPMLFFDDTGYPCLGLAKDTTGQIYGLYPCEGNTIVVGYSYTGKTYNYVRPTLKKYAERGESFVVTTLDSDKIEEDLTPLLSGYQTYVFDLDDLANGKPFDFSAVAKENPIISGTDALTSQIKEAASVCCRSYLEKGKTAVIIKLSDLHNTFAPLASVVLDALHNASYVGKKTLHFVLDEFAALPKIHALSSRIECAGRSFNCDYLVTIQTVSQLQAKYGHQEANEILYSFRYAVFLGDILMGTDADFVNRVLERNCEYLSTIDIGLGQGVSVLVLTPSGPKNAILLHLPNSIKPA